MIVSARWRASVIDGGFSPAGLCAALFAGNYFVIAKDDFHGVPANPKRVRVVGDRRALLPFLSADRRAAAAPRCVGIGSRARGAVRSRSGVALLARHGASSVSDDGRSCTSMRSSSAA
jgi:hypothetical protein